MPQQTLNENEINILYAPFTNIDTSIGYDLVGGPNASFELAYFKLCKSNKLAANNVIYSVIVSIEEQFNAARILDEYLQMSLGIKIIPAHLRSHDDWFIVMRSKNHPDSRLSESSHFVYGKYLAVNTK